MCPELNFQQFQNCLRIAIVPHYFENERIESVLEFCKKYSIRHIMLFINVEEYNLGHITKEEAKPWIETIKRAKKRFNEANIIVSLNPWMEIGHLDRGRKLKENQNFITMTDMNGLSCEMVACPLDKNWRKYYFPILRYFIEEVQPEIYWIEDDFRLHNHAPLEFGGCFCQNHMEKYNEKLGTNYSREEFVDKVFAKGGMNKEREAWLKVSEETMLDLSSEIGKHIQSLGYGTRVGLMSSMPREHCMEYRNWKVLHENLRAGREIIDRIHLPCYMERCGKVYWYDFNSISMVVRSFLPDETLVMPELENAAFSEFAKNSRFLGFQLESAAPLVICGMTYDIFDFVGNGALERLRYGEEIARVTPYLQGIQNLNLKFSQMRGVVVPVFEHACSVREIEKGWRDLYPEEFEIVGYLGCVGINYRFTHKKDLVGETVVLVNSVVDEFTDEELKSLFNNNFVVLDGGAALRLQKRNLSDLISMKSAEKISADSGRQSYEELVSSRLIDGILGYRASAQAKVGDYVSVDYVNSDIEIISNLYNEREEFVGNGMAIGHHFFLMPYVIREKQYELFNHLRLKSLTDWILLKSQKTVRTDECCVSPYLYEQEDRFVLLIVNSTVDCFAEIKLDLNFEFSKAEYISRNGEQKPLTYRQQNGQYIFDLELSYLSTATLLLYK